jgi:DNA-binding transcriptional LysR family regulator
MSVSLDYYMVFYYVAKYGSFSAAAKVLYSNQPNLTRVINNLEGELKCRLFVRSNRGVTLTPEGKILLKHMEVVHDSLDKAENELRNATGLKSGLLSLAVSETALNIFLLPKLKEFHSRYPGIHFRMSQSNSINSISALERGAADIAVVSTPIEISGTMKKIHMMDFKELLIAGPKSAEKIGEKISLSDFQSYNFICLSSETVTYEYYQAVFRKNEIKFSPATLVNTTDQILSLVKNDIGIGFVPEPYALKAISSGEVIPIEVDISLPVRSVMLVLDTKRTLSISAREFVKALRRKSY